MVKSKKLLSIFLAVVMVLSVFTVMASAAYTRVETEGTGEVEFKYSVEKVDMVPETAAGSAEWYADNIYAVTLWMKSAKPVDTIIAPFHYNKTLFAPITLSDGECTYPYGAGLDQDTYYSDMGEGAVYAYSLGDYMNNTGMYKADGSKATTKALAKCIGLGNSNAAAVKVQTEFVSPDHPNYAKWGEGLSADTGVVFAKVDVATNSKTAYLNTIEGIETSTDWNRMFVLYFESITDADVTGAEFGVFTDTAFGPDACYDANGKGYYESATLYDPRVPTINYVSNAVIEKAAAPELSVSWFKNQIRFDTDKNGAYANQFDYRIVGQFDNFEEIFADLNDAKAKITDVGYVFTNSEVMDVEAAKAQVEGGEVVYSQVTDCYVSTSFDGTDYAFACFVSNIADNDANKAATLYGLGYVIYENADGDTAYAYYDATLNVGALYNQYK